MADDHIPTLPPGPPDGSAEQVARFNDDAFGYLELLAEKYGTMFTLHLGNVGGAELPHIPATGAWVFLTRPHQIRAMYEADDDTASGAWANKVFFGTDEASVAYLDGPAHRLRRKQLHPTFNGNRDYSRLVLDVLDRCMARWPRGRAFPLFDRLQEMTAQVITDVVCGALPPVDQARLCAMLPVTEHARYSKQEQIAADAAIRSFVHRRIEGYRSGARTGGRQDVLAELLALAQEGDTSLSDEVVRDEVFSLLYTGFSTTANTLSWVLVHVLGDERLRRELIGEIRDVLGDRPLTRQTANELVLLDATIKETLRLHPVTPLNGVRMLKRPMEIDGYQLPAGTILVHCAYLLQRSPEVYPEPDRFSPERFLGTTLDPYVWAAFGGGHRICVGRGFSMNEMKLVLARLLAQDRLERTGGIPQARLQGFFMAPDDGAMVVLR